MRCGWDWAVKAGWLISFVENLWVAGDLFNTCHTQRFKGEFHNLCAIKSYLFSLPFYIFDSDCQIVYAMHIDLTSLLLRIFLNNNSTIVLTKAELLE